MMRRPVLAVIILILLVACAAGYYSYQHREEEASSDGGSHAGADHGRKGGKGNGPVPVGVATVTTGNVNVYLDGLGNITPRNTVTVHTRVNGQLLRLDFQEGQLVKEGDLLAEVDPRPYQAALDQAEGLLVRDKALLDEARIDLNRYRTLVAQDSIARQQYDLQASLVKQYEGDVQNDIGTEEAAKVNLIYTRITAPVGGRVGLRQVDPGNIVSTTDTNGVAIITTLQPITAIFTIPEDDIPDAVRHVAKNGALPAEAWDRANLHKLAQGSLSAIDNEVDPTTGTVKFRAVFPNADNALFPSEFVNIKLQLDTLENAVLAPSASIQRGTQGTFVYLVHGNTVSVQTVKIGPPQGENVAITEGLKQGDIVVVDGADTLRDKAHIEIATKDGKPLKEPGAKDNASKEGHEDGGKKHHWHKKPDTDTDSSAKPAP